jgi:hypothetical protein
LRFSQGAFKKICDRVRSSEHVPRGPFRFLDHRHGLAQIVERGTVVKVEQSRANQPHPERDIIRLAKNAQRYGHHFTKQ